MTIDYFSMGHPLSRLRSHYAWRAREHMLQRFLHVFQPGPHTRVLDLGVTPDIVCLAKALGDSAMARVRDPARRPRDRWGHLYREHRGVATRPAVRW